jgi:hypothetical protein
MIILNHFLKKKYRTSVAQGKSVDELTLEFKQLNPTENEIDI